MQGNNKMPIKDNEYKQENEYAINEFRKIYGNLINEINNKNFHVNELHELKALTRTLYKAATNRLNRPMCG